MRGGVASRDRLRGRARLPIRVFRGGEIVETRANTAQTWRFGVFEVDAHTMELRRGGTPVKLREQSFNILVFLLEHAGELVTREDLRRVLWPSDTFVDFDHSLNTAVMKLREALGDSADAPLYIETSPKRGYRFIAPVEAIGNGLVTSESTLGDTPVSDVPVGPVLPPRKKRNVGIVVFGLCLLLLVAGWFAYRKLRAGLAQPPVQRALTRLTFDEGLQTGATWSPDGRYLAYSSDRGGKFDIWVQQISGGDPIQITKGPGQNWQPDWSPDGKYITYRSEEGAGGIYITPALGGVGQQRKIASFGYYPQWSPDSSQVLFRTHFTAIGYSNRFYVARLDGSPSREVLAEFIAQNNLWATSAAWHTDGKRITVWVGSSSPTPVFWTVPLSGGPGIELEISPAVQKELAEASGETKASMQLGEYRFCWSPLGNAIYFVRGYRGARNIWKLTVDPGTMRATRIDRLTTGPGPESALAVSPDGKRLAFTAGSQRIQTWLFPFDATTGQIKGSGTAVTSPGRTSIDPQLSPDGAKVAYTVPYGESYGMAFGDVRNEVWVKSLVDGSEVPIPSDGYSSWDPLWSPDSAQLIYDRKNLRTNERQFIFWSSQNREEYPLTGVTKRWIYDWSPDGKLLLAAAQDGIWLVRFPPPPHADTLVQRIFSNPAYELYQPHMSPDDRWVVFGAGSNSQNIESSLFVVPASGGPSTRITDGRYWDDKPRWSPDGRTIYFVSGPGGFFNVWGIRFDPAVGKPVGQPFQVTKFDSPRLMIPRFIPPVGLSLTQDKLVLTMAQESGNIWVLDNVDR
jgi:Tol biopolymer transport system component/DNA-binding winged helix-turn-helix (wHTH) protein